MSAGNTAVLTEVFCALPQSLQVNTGLEPKFKLRLVSSVYFAEFIIRYYRAANISRPWSPEKINFV